MDARPPRRRRSRRGPARAGLVAPLALASQADCRRRRAGRSPRSSSSRPSSLQRPPHDSDAGVSRVGSQDGCWTSGPGRVDRRSWSSSNGRRRPLVALDDFSATYIRDHGPEKLKANLRAAGVDGRADVVSADMRQAAVPDASFDAHREHVRDRPSAVRRHSRRARGSGARGAARRRVPPRDHVPRRLDAVCLRAGHDARRERRPIRERWPRMLEDGRVPGRRAGHRAGHVLHAGGRR